MVKLEKLSMESENFSKIGGNLKQGKMHHCLRGMDAPVQEYNFYLSQGSIIFINRAARPI